MATYWNKDLCRYESITMSGSTSSSPYGSHQFSLDEDMNYDERVDWLRQLAPVFGPYDYSICSLLTYAYIGRNPFCQPDSLTPVEATPFTVEADGEGQFFTDVESLAWINRWDMDRFEFDGSDLFDLADIVDVVLFRLPIGDASVACCEVTL